MTTSTLAPGSVGWVDLTVDATEHLRDFYATVVGWRPEPVAMGGYDDFNMTDPASGEPRAGVCHRRGINADLPACWMVYITVADLDASVGRCVELGGRVLVDRRKPGARGGFCVIRDPAGAICALYEPPPDKIPA